jgi:hypothetical protein
MKKGQQKGSHRDFRLELITQLQKEAFSQEASKPRLGVLRERHENQNENRPIIEVKKVKADTSRKTTS